MLSSPLLIFPTPLRPLLSREVLKISPLSIPYCPIPIAPYLLQELLRVEASLRPALQLLASLFALKCVLKGSAFFLASGALGAAELGALRAALHELYRALSAGGGRLALRLCDGFGIPEPLITAPIAKVWCASMHGRRDGEWIICSC